MKVSRLFFIGVFTILSVNCVFSAQVDTLSVFSKSMNKGIKTVVVKPDNYDDDEKFPVLYLLHGYSGNYASWVNGMPSTKDLADKYQMLLICPDGAYGSWYFDSPIDPDFRYETFLTKELVAWVDSNYKTDAKRETRAITGLSMGGHGGLFIGFRHQELFGACGSMSGGVDFRSFPKNWDLPKRLGSYSNNQDVWDSHVVMNQLHLLAPGSCAIIIDCGVDDFFYPMNVRLHEELIYRNIPHDFISRPGKHDATYWDNAVQYQGLFFSNYFKNK